MTAPMHNTVAWFQIASDEPDEVKKFYGGLFGWTFTPDPQLGDAYEMITYAGGDRPQGGLLPAPNAAANHAIFSVLVGDVATTVADAERLGAKILVPITTTPNGLVFAELLDSSGNHFGVFCPPPA